MDRTPNPAALSAPDAGGRVIRGGALRAASFVASFGIAAITSVLLLRHLGVDDFGRYSTVAALMGIVSGVTDVGLTSTGARELSLVHTRQDRARILGNLFAIRMLVTPVGVLAATLFAILAGYPSVLVEGTLLVGVSVILIGVQATLIQPLTVDLRNGAIAAVELLRYLVTLVGVVALVIAGATLLPFFAVQIAVGLVSVAVTYAVLGSDRSLLRPHLDRATATHLLREALPLAAALTMNLVYFRTLIVLMSLLTGATQTGLFATSFRVTEVLFGLPQLVLVVAMPVLAVAGRDDLRRLGAALSTMTRTMLVAGIATAMAVAVAAEPALVLLGGEQYRDAAPILAVQALAFIPLFVGQAWQATLVSVSRQRLLIHANGAALLTVLVGGLIVIPSGEAQGAAIVAVVGECVLALGLYLGLRTSGLHPGVAGLPRIAIALAPAVAIALVPGLHGFVAAALAAVVFVGLAVLTRALPREVITALLAVVPRRAA